MAISRMLSGREVRVRMAPRREFHPIRVNLSQLPELASEGVKKGCRFKWYSYHLLLWERGGVQGRVEGDLSRPGVPLHVLGSVHLLMISSWVGCPRSLDA